MSHTLKLVLTENELLVLQLSRPTRVTATSGRHWLTVDGRDICLGPDCRDATLPRGKVLIEGSGRLELSAAPDTRCPQPRLRLNTLSI
jgi:hypothetical protein